MLSLLHSGCTRVLDLAILEERVRYAQERVDYHELTRDRPVQAIQRILRDRNAPDRRFWVIADLLEAQRTNPHRLWELLLVQAFESTLVRRRLAVSVLPNAALAELVLHTFLEALQYPPASLEQRAGGDGLLRAA